jgi:hypothetical protein
MIKIRRCLDNQLTDGGKVVSPMHRPRSTPQKNHFSASGTNICWRLSKPQGLVRPEVSDQLKIIIHLIGSRTRDFPAGNIVS